MVAGGSMVAQVCSRLILLKGVSFLHEQEVVPGEEVGLGSKPQGLQCSQLPVLMLYLPTQCHHKHRSLRQWPRTPTPTPRPLLCWKASNDISELSGLQWWSDIHARLVDGLYI